MKDIIDPDHLDSLTDVANLLRHTGYFLDVAALPGADRIVAIDMQGETHTWTLDGARQCLKQIEEIMAVQ